MCGSLSTSDPGVGEVSCWQSRQLDLIASLRRQPLLMVVRPQETDLNRPLAEAGSFWRLLESLALHGVHHVEVAWSRHPRWPELIQAIQHRFPAFSLGAASIVCRDGLECAAELGLAYAMSPCLDDDLIAHSRVLGQVLVPGVMTPTEIHRAALQGCRLVKLFPAAALGIDYHRQLSAPMGSLPFMVAAGGLRVNQLSDWLHAGYDAIALGRSAIHADCLDPVLHAWLESNRWST